MADMTLMVTIGSIVDLADGSGDQNIVAAASDGTSILLSTPNPSPYPAGTVLQVDVTRV
jgi:hypothetical protein